MRKLYGIHSNPQFLNDVRLDFVQVSLGRKGLTADYAPRWFVRHAQHHESTALISKRHTVAQQFGGVVLLLGFFEFKSLMLCGCDEPTL